MSFDRLGLSAEILHALQSQGYSSPTPIQQQAIPAILQGRDVLGAAQTGTGKTAGFTLPMLEILSRNPGSIKKRRPVRALILTPTRELAAQVGDNVRAYGRNLPLTTLTVFGGVNINPQFEKLRRGVDILIATPGRLLDHANQRTVDLSQVEILVLDEADRMLDMGFIRDIRKIMDYLPAPRDRQTLMFSATFSRDIKTLSRQMLENPKQVEVAAQNSTADKITQKVHLVDKGQKRSLLSHLIKSNDWEQVLVFTRTKHGANRLAGQLEKDGLSAAAIHGNKSQGARTRALSAFKKGEVRILVATDIAARGLDIDQLPHVVNYELPNVPEDYVHRIGRTARAGHSGEATSLVSADELDFLRDIEKLVKQKIERVDIDGYQITNMPKKEAPEKSARVKKPSNNNTTRSRRSGKKRSGSGGAGRQHRKAA